MSRRKNIIGISSESSVEDLSTFLQEYNFLGTQKRFGRKEIAKVPRQDRHRLAEQLRLYSSEFHAAGEPVQAYFASRNAASLHRSMSNPKDELIDLMRTVLVLRITPFGGAACRALARARELFEDNARLRPFYFGWFLAEIGVRFYHNAQLTKASHYFTRARTWYLSDKDHQKEIAGDRNYLMQMTTVDRRLEHSLATEDLLGTRALDRLRGKLDEIEGNCLSGSFHLGAANVRVVELYALIQSGRLNDARSQNEEYRVQFLQGPACNQHLHYIIEDHLFNKSGDSTRKETLRLAIHSLADLRIGVPRLLMCAGDSPYDLQFLGQYGPGRDQPQLQHTGGFGQYNEKVEKLAAADWDVYCPSDGRVSVPDSYEVTARKSRKVKDRKKKKRDRTKLYTIISDLDIDKGTRLSQVRCEHQATVDDVEKLGKYASRCGIFIDEENGGNRGIAVRRIADDGSLRNRPKHHKFEELRGKGPVFVAYLLKALSGQFELTYEKLVASLFPYSSPDDSGIKFGRAKIRVHQTIGNIARHSKKRTRTKKGSGRTSPKSVNGVLNGALNDYLVGESGVGYKLKENRPSFCYICPVDHEAAIPLTDILESENS